MNETTETLPAAPVDDVRARNKAIVFAALAEAGIHKVTVEYDGGGDSGQIEDVAARNAGAFGVFVFDVTGRLVTLEHNERYTEVNTINDEF